MPAGSGRAAGSPRAGSDPPPAWSDFSDPLDAIAGRFGRRRAEPQTSRFTREEQRALSILGLGEDADRHAVRKRYSTLVRRFHPDRNGGDRSQEERLGRVIDAYQLLQDGCRFRLVAVRSAKGEIGPVGPGFLDDTGDLRMSQQPGAIRLQLGTFSPISSTQSA